ncbi:MAG: hypothetical protein JWL70_1870, partial [Acidimicrobiia bacterium]|nr:hypothetical protein [Acidimicrobiia bacterium]
LAEDYDLAQTQLADLNAQIAQTQTQLAKTTAAGEAVRGQMKDWATRSYTDDSSADPTLAMLQPVQGLDVVAAQEGYTDVALGRNDQLTAELHQHGQDVALLQDRLVKQQSQQKALISTAEARHRDAQNAEAQAAGELQQAQNQLGDLLVQEQQRRAQAALISAQQASLAISQARKATDASTRTVFAASAQSAARPSVAASGGAGGSPRLAAVAVPPAANNIPARPIPAGPSLPAPSPGAAGAVAAARSQLGVPYHWGQMNPGSGFDCSGLTAWAWGQAGRSLPHNAAAQYNVSRRVDIADIQPGDILFYGSPIHHDGMYIGNGQMIEAPHTGASVRIASAFRSDLVGIGRP